MATTRKSTTKKTTKKPASVRSAKTTRAKVTTKKSATRKSINANVSTKADTKAAVKTVRSQRGVFEKLRSWNLATALLLAAQAVAIVLLANERSYPVTTSYNTTDSLASLGGDQVLVSASRVLFDVRMSWLLAAILGIAALTHLALATVRRRSYETGLDLGVNKTRSFGNALSFGLMAAALSLVTGITDKPLLAMIFGATAVSCLAGFLSERNNIGRQVKDKSMLVINLLAGAAPWIVLAWYVFSSNRWGEALQPGSVLVLLGSMLVIFTGFPLVHSKWLNGKGRWANYMNVEKAYLLLTVVATAALTWQIYALALR